ncbi:MAG TPA: hypothetical protein VFR99_12935 [Marmoricola sp.]|nr:hypothetical protein [Marmoricola sp.]
MRKVAVRASAEAGVSTASALLLTVLPGLAALAALAGLAGLTGCGPSEVQIARQAVKEAATTVGDHGVTSIRLNADEISRLAEEAGVSDSVIRDTAPRLDDESLWSSSLLDLEELYSATPGEIRSNLVGLACDGARGQITSQEQLIDNVAHRFPDRPPTQIHDLADDVVQLWQDLYDASNSNDPQLQASAVLTCFTVEQVVGED